MGSHTAVWVFYHAQHIHTHTHTHTHTNFLALNVIIILCIPAGSVVCTTSSKHLKNQPCILVHLYKHMVTFGAIAATSLFVSNSFCEIHFVNSKVRKLSSYLICYSRYVYDVYMYVSV